MGEVISWGMAVILTAFVLGLYSDMFIDSRDRSAMGIFLLVAGTLLLVVCVVCFTFVNQKYFEKEEYSATEYYLNRKIIINTC